MKSLNRLGARSVSLPLSADDIVEFHAARLLLLLSVCGVAGRIDGLTKMAKLDFFARYPDFSWRALPIRPPSDPEFALMRLIWLLSPQWFAITTDPGTNDITTCCPT
jgi:hypothetical protein